MKRDKKPYDGWMNGCIYLLFGGIIVIVILTTTILSIADVDVFYHPQEKVEKECITSVESKIDITNLFDKTQIQLNRLRKFARSIKKEEVVIEETKEEIIEEKLLLNTITEEETITNFFETNKCFTTTYTYTDEIHPQQDGKYYYDWSASQRTEHLIALDDNSVIDDGYVIHSVASDWSVLPEGSIIYLPQLDKYFRVDDNNGCLRGKKNPCTKIAWNVGCSFWIDIYVGKSGYEGKNGIIQWYGDKEWCSPMSQDIITYVEEVSKAYHQNNGYSIFEFKLIRLGW